jgi:uncharacterized hydrophobic protein (TIGR00271 family)
MELLSNIVQDNKFTPADVPVFEEKLFFEGAKRRVNLERFAALLFLSTVIATYGVLGDSVATIIGAMIIAPLMKPIMATAAGLVMGDMRRAGRSFLTVILGVTGVIFTAWFLSSFLNTTVVSFNTNPSITGRISPSLTDLMVALASGAAGAFAMSRSDVADTLPGVAIAISLVPPLCVVGIGLSEGEFEGAWGAMLLFLTNFLSILLAGGGVLALLGLSAASTKQLKGSSRRKAFSVIIIGLLLVAIPLAIHTISVSRETRAELQTQRLAEIWLAGTEYQISKIDAQGHQIELVINGSGVLPATGELGAELRSKVDPRTQMTIRILPAQTHHYPESAAE